MKSKILTCLVLASCSTMQVSEDKVKDVYTDIVKSADWMKTSNGISPILVDKEDAYLCDYGYIEESNKKEYRRFCDKDGKLLNGYVEASFDDGWIRGNRKYFLTDGKVYYKEDETHRPANNIYTYSFMSHDEIASYSVKGEYDKIYCDNNDIIGESWDYSGGHIYSYNKVKKDGVAIDKNLIMVKNRNGEYFYKIDDERQMDGHFEALDCRGKVKISFTLLNGKYDGEKVGEDYFNVAVEIKRTYKNGEMVSKSIDYILPRTDDDVTYNKKEFVKNGDKWTCKYYLKDKLVKEMDSDEEPV